jgi:hypothetical protein
MEQQKCWLIESWCEYEDGDLSSIYLRNIFLDEDLARKHFADMFANDFRDGFNPVFKSCSGKVISFYSCMLERFNEKRFYRLREMEISN